EEGDPEEAIRRRTYAGTTGNLGLEQSLKQLRQQQDRLSSRKQAVDRKLKALVGFAVSLHG
ncbi:MAG: argininosuccinate lyase, partial [Spirochaetaceae bacterium]